MSDSKGIESDDPSTDDDGFSSTHPPRAARIHFSFHLKSLSSLFIIFNVLKSFIKYIRFGLVLKIFQWFSNNCFCWRMFINYPIAASLVVSAESISRKDYRKGHQMVGDRRKAYHHTLLRRSIRTTHHSSSSIRPSCCIQISSHTLSNILKDRNTSRNTLFLKTINNT